MKRINPDKMSKAELDALGEAADAVTFENTRPLSADGRRALARAANKGHTQRGLDSFFTIAPHSLTLPPSGDHPEDALPIQG